MYSSDVLNSVNPINFILSYAFILQHSYSLPNSLDPSTSKLTFCCLDLIFHHYKTSVTYNCNYLATNHCFLHVIL